jgi:hypothetical protein
MGYGALYHLTSRGNERKAIYRDEEDRLNFLYRDDERRRNSRVRSCSLQQRLKCDMIAAWQGHCGSNTMGLSTISLRVRMRKWGQVLFLA